MSSRSRSHSAMEGDDFESSSPAVSEDAGPQPSQLSEDSNKRRRLNDGTPQRENVDDSWILDPPRTGAHGRPSRAQQLSAPPSRELAAQFQAGQIVRVYMKNFVTYTEAVVYPGPTLNMVIGPNGTGKSTLVCAICLGLGFSPSLLGRAKETGEFIKNGCREASIEIELKGKPGQPNTIMRRTLKKEGNKSTFLINGESSNNKKTMEAVRKFNIQVDNLCHFLPQDRVVEFSQLGPVDRLEQTLKATAPDEIFQAYEELKELREQQRKHEGQEQSWRNQLQSAQTRQEGQRADVDRMRARAEFKEKIDWLERVKPIVKAQEVKAQAKEAKETVRALNEQLRECEARLAPSLLEENAKKAYVNEIATTLQNRARKTKIAQQVRQRHEKAIAATQTKLTALTTRKKTLAKTLKNHQADVSKYEEQIRKIDDEIARGAPDTDIATLTTQIRDIERQLETIRRETREINDRRAEAAAIKDDRQKRIRSIEHHLESLNTAAGRRGQNLRSNARDAATAWAEVQKRRSDFKGPVYGPAVLECTLSDKSYANALETLISEGDLTALTVTTKEDFQVLQDIVYGQLQLKSVTLRSSASNLQDPRFGRNISAEDEAALGVEAWAVDLLEGPETVLAMLCETSRLHGTAVCNREVDESLKRQIRDLDDIANYISPSQVYRIRRRKEYNQISLTDTALRTSKYWNEAPVDNSGASEARHDLQQLKIEMEELDKNAASQRAVLEEKEREKARLEEEKEPLEEDKVRQQTRETRWQGLPSRKQIAQSNLDSAEEKLKELEETIKTEINEEEPKLMSNKAQDLINLANAMQALQQEMVSEVEAQIAKIEAESDLEQITLLHAGVTAEREAKAKERDAAEADRARLRSAFGAANERAISAAREHDGLQEFFHGLPEDQQTSLHALGLEIGSIEAQLEMLAGGNEGLLQEFEARARKIEELQSRLANWETEAANLQARIHAVRAEFEPFADRMVETISGAFANEFAKINCTGAVELDKTPGDTPDAPRADSACFDKWRIQILVSFRRDAPMQELDSHRQSGGERAVSTIFYLMALQATSRAPFRIVDEINQGMDPRNERVVHGRLVKIACGEPADGGDAAPRPGSQYFLVTPKLLTGLEYMRGMKVHCIASGEHMPADPGAVDLKALAKKARDRRFEVRGRVAASAAA